MILSAPGIFYSWESFVLWYCLESVTETSVHFSNVLLFTRQPGMGRWFLCTFKWAIYYFIYKIKRQYRYCQSPNRSKNTIQNWPRYFLCFWCGVQGSHGQGKRCFFFQGHEILKLVREKWFFGKKEFYDDGTLIVQLLSWSDKWLRQFPPFCIIVVIINIYTHFVPY